MTINTSQKQYRISVTLNQEQLDQMLVQNLGTEPDRLQLTLEGWITPEQFHNIFGPDYPMVTALVENARTSENLTVQLRVSDATAKHNRNSWQEQVINQLLEEQQLPQMDQPKLSQQARLPLELSLPAAAFLLSCFELSVDYPEETDRSDLSSLLKAANLNLSDFLKD